MKIRLTIILILLVVVPTAILSLMASRALKSWESDLQSGLVTSAESAVDVVDQQMQSHLDEDMDRVRNAMSDCLSHGSRYEFGASGTAEAALIQSTASALTEELRTVNRVFVFMNPWGFLFEEKIETRNSKLETRGEGEGSEGGRDGEEGKRQGGGGVISNQWTVISKEGEQLGENINRRLPEPTARVGQGLTPMEADGGRDGDAPTVEQENSAPSVSLRDNSSSQVSSSSSDGLIDVLRREIASRPSLTGAIKFVYNNEIYCFSLLRDRKGIYAGCQVDQDGLNSILKETLERVSGKGFVLSAGGPGFEMEDLVVTDPFGVSLGGRRVAVDADLMFSRRLISPFNYIEIKAYIDDPESFQHGGAMRARLFRWGIGLLAASIITGMGIVLLAVGSEIRKAGERNDFIMGVSHDLRTPISSIKMLSESLLIGSVPDKAKQSKFLGTIVGECDELADMIERVLSFMRQEHEADVYSFAQVDIGVLVSSVVDAFRGRMHGGMDVDLQISDGLPLVRADAAAISKVVYNLLDNAAKYAGGEEQLPVVSNQGAAAVAQRLWRAMVDSEEGKRPFGAAQDREGAVISNQWTVDSEEGKRQGVRGKGENEKGTGEKISRRSMRRQRLCRTSWTQIQRDSGRDGVSPSVEQENFAPLAPLRENSQVLGLSPCIDVTVDLDHRWRRDWVVITVQDHGIGIDRKEIRKIFRKFYRAGIEATGKVGGIGLGLAICKGIVRAHKGKIKVESAPGKGSRFMVYLRA